MAGTEPPGILADLAPGWTATLAYQLIPAVSTWRLTAADGSVRFAKVARGHTYPSLDAEAERMVWAAPYLPVPTVVALEHIGPDAVLITEGLSGVDATHASLRSDMAGLVAALGDGLAASTRRWAKSGARSVSIWPPPWIMSSGECARDVDPRGFHPEHRHLTPDEALDLLTRTAPDREDLVVCHGDYCPPNVLLSAGRVNGYVDLGELAVADRWWDIAIGGWSVGWNFGLAFESHFYESYGIAPDPDRIAFYRLLYDLVS